MATRLFGSQTSLREANRANLLASIHKFGAMTQVELAEVTGLSTATVSTLVHQLVDEDQLETKNTVRNGRRATLVTLARHQGLGVGLWIARRHLTLSIVDFSKSIIAEHTLPLPLGHKADTTLERAMLLINETLSSIDAEASELVGIGVAVAAPVATSDHTIAIPGILPGWDGVDITSPLRTAFNVPVYVDIVDFSKSIIAEHTLPLPLGHKADTTLERAMLLINETLSSIDAEASELVGIGVAVAAPVATSDHTIAIPGILPGWDGVDITSPLRTAFNVPVYVDNDANFAAYGESRMGVAAGKRNFVYISASDGVGAGIVINGEIMHGVTGLAGEIGHIQVDPLGAICSCGNRGCLDTVVAENRLVQLLSVTHGNMTLDDLVSFANEGDPGCRRIIADAAVRIGQVAADLCISVDPEVIVLGGKLAMTGDVFIQPFNEALQRMLFPDAVAPIDVLVSSHPDDNC